MFDIHTELHLRRLERDATADREVGHTARAILIVANLSALSVLATALF